MNLDDLPLEIINEIAIYLPYDDYLNFIDAYPLAYDIMLLRKYNTKYEHEIIKYDNSSKDEMVIREIRKVGRIKIVIKGGVTVWCKRYLRYYELFCGNSTTALFFEGDYESECVFHIDNESLIAGHTELKLVDKELDLIEELIDCYSKLEVRCDDPKKLHERWLYKVKWMNRRQKLIQYE